MTKVSTTLPPAWTNDVEKGEVKMVVPRMNQTSELCPTAGLGDQHEAVSPGPVQRQLERRMNGPSLTPSSSWQEEETEGRLAEHTGYRVDVVAVALIALL